MGGVSESDREQPERAGSTGPVRYTIQSLANAFDVLRRWADGDASAARNGDKPAAEAPGPGDPGGQ